MKLSLKLIAALGAAGIFSLTAARPTFATSPDYIVTTTTGASIVPGTSDVGNHCDDCLTNDIPLPFPVIFYDQVFTTFDVSSNGHLTFTNAGNSDYDFCLPHNTISYLIAPGSADLFTNDSGSGQGIFTSVSGVAPNRIFNIEWRTKYCCDNGPPTVNFEIRLYEGKQRIDFIYGAVNGHLDGIGVQRDTGSQFTLAPISCGNAPAAGTQYTFTIPCTPTVGQAFTVLNTNDSGTGSLRQAILDANANPGGDSIVFDSGVIGTITLTSGELLITECLFINGPGANILAVNGNAASRVFDISSGIDVTISGLTITNGNAGDFGGGIFNNGATLTITDSTLSGNSAGSGGGIFNDERSGIATLQITNSTLSGNSAAGSGSGIYNFGGAATITNSTLSGNSGGSGGGIFNDGITVHSATLQITNSTLSGNSAVGSSGGGIYNFGGAATITNSTLSGNSGGSGGGIFNDGSAGSATFEIGNTILKTGAAGENIFNNSGTVTSDGYNLSSDNGGGFLTATGDQINTDPLLGPLQDNGGPTFTHALLVGSPAIDTGKDLSGTGQDQRGSVRPFDLACIPNASGGDGSDIGAYEVQNTAPTISAASGVTRQQDAGVSNSSIARVNDAEDPKNTLSVTVNGSTSATTSGVTISNIVVDSSGNVTADIAAACGATAADFTLRVTDCDGLFAEATLHIAVTAETTPPVITSISASPSVLKPPNHTLRLVTVSVSDSDNCDPNPVCRIISVTSNQPDSGCSSGDKPNDIQNISGLTVQLRAERCGTGTSRIYTITVQCTDASGNASTRTTTVTVKK